MNLRDAIIMALTTITLVAACGQSGGGSSDAPAPEQNPAPAPDPAPAPAAPTFADIAPILATNCAPCHNAGGRLAAYASGDETLVADEAGEIVERIVRAADAPGVMPPLKSGKVVSEADKTKLLRFLESAGK